METDELLADDDAVFLLDETGDVDTEIEDEPDDDDSMPRSPHVQTKFHRFGSPEAAVQKRVQKMSESCWISAGAVEASLHEEALNMEHWRTVTRIAAAKLEDAFTEELTRADGDDKAMSSQPLIDAVGAAVDDTAPGTSLATSAAAPQPSQTSTKSATASMRSLDALEDETLAPTLDVASDFGWLSMYPSRAAFDAALRGYHSMLPTSCVNFRSTSSPTMMAVICTCTSSMMGGTRGKDAAKGLVHYWNLNADACKFVVVAQRVKRRLFLERKWRMSPLATAVGDEVSGSEATRKQAQVHIEPNS